MSAVRTLLAALLVARIIAAEQPRTGTVNLSFTERSPFSAYEAMSRRMGWGKSDPDADYDLAGETFEAHVPPAYDPASPWGLVVFINSGKGGNAWYYAEVMASRRLIWIASADSPNERHFPIRLALALDAAWNMQQRFRIDPRRVYLCGLSGGGRCASELAPVYPDVFNGALYFCGCNPPNWPSDRAAGLPLRRLAGASRFALMTGSGDPNRNQTRSLADAYPSLGLTRSAYFEEPGLGHAMPTPAWFTRGIDFLDAPLLAEASAQVTQAKASAQRRPLESWLACRGLRQGYPVAEVACREAEQLMRQLAESADAALRSELAGAATGDRLRALAVKAVGLPCADAVRAKAAAAGMDDLARLGAACEPRVLLSFSAMWQGYECADQADTMYARAAAEALSPILAMDPPLRARQLQRFVVGWAPCPARAQAEERLEAYLKEQVQDILAYESAAGRVSRLKAFVAAWPGTAAARAVQARLQRAQAKDGR